uniref:SMF protein n=1 Tax=Chlorobium chlorochromatii (strain CaD3) TaxID=340177 RepID=Q3AQM2_CHLCH
MDILNFLMLSQVPGIGAARIKALLTHWGNLSFLQHATIADLTHINGIGETLATELYNTFHNAAKNDTVRRAAEAQLLALERCNGQVLTLLDEGYPPLLREIYDPPPCLFIRGTLPPNTEKSLAVVGTRHASAYGKQVTTHFCHAIAKQEMPIISGLAYGIDMAAHQAALDAGGTTVAVLASGIDTIYTDPKGLLWPKILEHGAIVSEEWIGSHITPAKFPKRNRIISGIAKGTLVVESDLKGGALITATTALEQNREVFAVPGSIFSHTSRGTNKLIQQGQAKAIMEVDDILMELQPSQPHQAKPIHPTKATANATTTTATTQLPLLNPLESQIYQALSSSDPTHIDTLAATLQLDLSTLFLHLFELELQGVIEQQPGQLFLRKA